MDKLSEIKRLNLIEILKKRGIRQNELAELIKVTSAHVSALINGKRNLGPRTISKIATALNVSEFEFVLPINERAELPNRSYGPIPVISWVHAGIFAEPVDLWPVGISGEGDPVFSHHKVSSYAFSLWIEGDSMEPRYMHGDRIVVDPEIRCDNGSPCVVWLNGEVAFRIFKETDTEIILSPLNDRHETRTIKKGSKADFRVIGKVVDMIPKL